MARLKQVFKNAGYRPLIIFLELSTARYRVVPKQELTLQYDDNADADGPGAPLRIEYMMDGHDPQIVIYTSEDTMFLSNGDEAKKDYS